MCHLFVSFFAFQKTGPLHCGCLWSLGSDFGQTNVRNIFNWHCIALHCITFHCIALVPFFSLLPLPPSPQSPSPSVSPASSLCLFPLVFYPRSSLILILSLLSVTQIYFFMPILLVHRFVGIPSFIMTPSISWRLTEEGSLRTVRLFMQKQME